VIRWTFFGQDKPPVGTERKDEEAVTAFKDKFAELSGAPTLGSEFIFAEVECKAWGLTNLKATDYINAGNEQQPMYYRPAPPEQMDGASIVAKALAQQSSEIDTCAIFCRKYQVFADWFC